MANGLMPADGCVGRCPVPAKSVVHFCLLNGSKRRQCNGISMDLRLLFALIAFLGGVWAYLLKVILDLTIAAPAAPHLLALAVAHYVVFIYLLLTLALFYAHGLSTINLRQPRYSDSATRIVFGTWPVALMALALGIVFAKAEFARPVSAATWILPSIALLLAILAFYSLRKLSPTTDFPRKRWLYELTGFVVLLALLFIPYLLAMSYIFSDVKVSFNRKMYTNEDIIVSLRRSGYVFAPTIESLECGNIKQTVPGDGAYILPSSEVGSATFLGVVYRPQAYWGSRSHFEDVMIAKPIVKQKP